MYKGRLFGEFVDEIDNLVSGLSHKKNKVLYGYQWNHGGGTCLEWILKNFYDIECDYRVDDNWPYGGVFRRNLLEYLEVDETGIIAATDSDLSFLSDMGYHNGLNYFNVLEQYGIDNVGYFNWMEKRFGIDVISREMKADLKSLSEDARPYAVSRGMGILQLCSYIHDKYPDREILDIGCGKGGAMIAFADFQCGKKIDGIELVKEFCVAGEQNLEKLGLDGNIICTDSLAFDAYDGYDMFYLYDPFRGDAFSKTMERIEESFRRNKREILIIYADPWEHRKVIKNNIFMLQDQILGDWGTRMVNVYITA